MINKLVRLNTQLRGVITKVPRQPFSDQWKKRDEAAEKEFILKEEQNKIKKLKNQYKNKQADESGYVFVQDYDACQVLDARDQLI